MYAYNFQSIMILVKFKIIYALYSKICNLNLKFTEFLDVNIYNILGSHHFLEYNLILKELQKIYN